MSCSPRELKKFRRFPVPADAFEAGRRRLLIVMADAPFALKTRPRRFGFLVVKPAMTAAVACVLVLSGGGVVLASQGSLPGERLYPVKLASEEVQERLTISPARKFAVQAAHAARRLEETERLMVRNGLAQDDRIGRVQTALHAYELHLFDMNAIALRLSVDPPKAKAGNRAIQAAEKMFDRHADLIASATVTQPFVAEAVLEPVGATLDLQRDVLDSLPAASWDSLEREDLRERHRHRTEKIQEHLRALQFELELEKPMENLPKL